MVFFKGFNSRGSQPIGDKRSLSFHWLLINGTVGLQIYVSFNAKKTESVSAQENSGIGKSLQTNGTEKDIRIEI